MNALIGLNHFCDNHGPSNIFSTQTLREKSFRSLQQVKSNSSQSPTLESSLCPGCNSIGREIIYYSRNKENEGSIMFVSSEKAIFGKEINLLLRNSAIHSLSCEVSSNKKDEGFVYFGDSRGHVLSCSFNVRDSMARGFFKHYSITIIMIDKMFLLNIQPHLKIAIKKIVNDIQTSAENVYQSEQGFVSQRAERLNNSGRGINNTPRSLKELTGESNIFAHLHSQFAWILWAGGRYYTECLTLGNPTVPAFLDSPTKEEGFSFIQIDKEEFLMKKFEDSLHVDSNKDEFDGENFALENFCNLRNLKYIMDNNFVNVCYCVLVGIQVVVRASNPQKRTEMIQCFKEILPSALHRTIVENSPKYTSHSKTKILTVGMDVPVPSINSNIFRIDFLDDTDIPLVKWSGELPLKLPTLLNKIIKAVDAREFTNCILTKYVKSLVEEWKNKAVCLSHVNAHEDMIKIKRTLNIQFNDEVLIKYWLDFMLDS